MREEILHAFNDELQKIGFKTGGMGVAKAPGAKPSGMSFGSKGGLKVGKPKVETVAVAKKVSGTNTPPPAVAEASTPPIRIPKSVGTPG